MHKKSTSFSYLDAPFAEPYQELNQFEATCLGQVSTQVDAHQKHLLKMYPSNSCDVRHWLYIQYPSMGTDSVHRISSHGRILDI